MTSDRGLTSEHIHRRLAERNVPIVSILGLPHHEHAAVQVHVGPSQHAQLRHAQAREQGGADFRPDPVLVGYLKGQFDLGIVQKPRGRFVMHRLGDLLARDARELRYEGIELNANGINVMKSRGYTFPLFN